MNMRVILIICLLIPLSTLAKELTMKKDCRNMDDMNSCSGTCVEYGYTVTFLINDNNIIKRLYHKNKLAGNSPLENCTVISSNDWHCEKKNGSSGSIDRMIDGIYSFYQYTELPNRPLPVLHPGACAK